MITGNLRVAGRKKQPPKKNFASLGATSPKSRETKCKKDEVITETIKKQEGGSGQSQSSLVCSPVTCERCPEVTQREAVSIKHSKLIFFLNFHMQMFSKDQRLSFQETFCCRHISSPSPSPTPGEGTIPAAVLILGTLPLFGPQLNV